MRALTRIGSDGLGSEAYDIALLDQKTDRIGIRAGRVRAVLLHPQICIRADQLISVRPKQDPLSTFDSAVLSLPCVDMVAGQQEVAIRGTFRREIQNRDRS